MTKEPPPLDADGKNASLDPGRAEEVIAEVYRQILAIRQAGGSPRRAVMPPKLWRLVTLYRQNLGPLQGSLPDYLNEEGLFGLELWYSDDPEIRVE